MKLLLLICMFVSLCLFDEAMGGLAFKREKFAQLTTNNRIKGINLLWCHIVKCTNIPNAPKPKTGGKEERRVRVHGHFNQEQENVVTPTGPIRAQLVEEPNSVKPK